MKIIYKNSQGGVAIIHPTGELPIEEVARKDVPADVPYLIIQDTAIPADRTFRDAWEADFSSPHGYGAPYGAGTDWAVMGYSPSGVIALLRNQKTGGFTSINTETLEFGASIGSEVTVDENGQFVIKG